MGVVNVTPDSFSDGGLHFAPEHAISAGLQMLEEGADILDIGGESTRPGVPVGVDSATGQAALVSAEEELRRVLPVVRGILRERPEAVLSVDTYKSAVAREAVAEGAEIVNDVSGLQWDGEMAATCAHLQCGLVLMHSRGLPKDWHKLPRELEITSLVEHDLANRLQVALQRGIARGRIVLDPGFGFGKNFEENYPLLAHFDHLSRLGFPLLAGTSRKGFIGRTVGQRRAERSTALAPQSSIGKDKGLSDDWRETAKDAPTNERLYGSLAAMVSSILKGAHIVRVHEVKPAVEAAAVADAILQAENV
jgi:dihydropteroate synthase